MKKLSILFTFFVVAGIAILAGSKQVYVLAGGTGALMYSRGPEAIIFLGESSRGYHFTYLLYPLNFVPPTLLPPPEANDQCGSSLYVHISPSGVTRSIRNTDNDNGPSNLTPFGDGIYARCRGDVLCKWDGKLFAPVSAEESQRFGTTSATVKVDKNHEIVNGWLVSYLRRNPGEHFSIALSPDLTISATTRDSAGADFWAEVDLLRPNQPPETLYNRDGRPHTVSKAEYDRAFATCKQ